LEKENIKIKKMIFKKKLKMGREKVDWIVTVRM